MDGSAESLQQEAEGRVGATLLGKWRLDALLGCGGMAAVYSATHRNGARGAVKLLHRPQSQDDEIRGRFLREGYIANNVEHPGAVRVLDDDVAEDGSAFLVMELLEGLPLNERAAAQGGTMSVEQVALVADQLLDVLAAAHARGIVHRDIKPDNVFLTHDGRVKILDFGIARFAERSAEEEWLRCPRTQTQAGLPMGTPAFMAPEQARGRWDLVGAQSDLWSVGATLFTLLSGQFVHPEETVSEILAAAFTRPARSLAAAMPDAPAPLVEVVDRALQLKVADRWPDARAMQTALREAYRAIFDAPMPSIPSASIVRRSDPPTNGPGEITQADPLPPPRSPSVSAPPVETILPPPSLALGKTARRRRRAAVLGGAAAIAACAIAMLFAPEWTQARTEPKHAALAPAPTHAAEQATSLAADTAAATEVDVAPPSPTTPVASRPTNVTAAIAVPAATFAPTSSAPRPSAAPAVRIPSPRRRTPARDLFDRRY